MHTRRSLGTIDLTGISFQIFKEEITPIWGFSGDSDGKESTCNARDLGSIPGLGRSPGEGNGYPLRYSCLEHSMDRGAWRATVREVPQSWTWLSNFHSFILSTPISNWHLQKIKKQKWRTCVSCFMRQAFPWGQNINIYKKEELRNNLKDIYTKNLNKILVKWIWQYVKKTICSF